WPPRVARRGGGRAPRRLRRRGGGNPRAGGGWMGLGRKESPSRAPAGKPPQAFDHDIAVPFRIRTPGGLLSFFSMTTVFGTPVDVMLSELALELFFPADTETAVAVQRMAATGKPQ